MSRGFLHQSIYKQSSVAMRGECGIAAQRYQVNHLRTIVIWTFRTLGKVNLK